MTFPDGRIKDGLFENNVFKGKTIGGNGSNPSETQTNIQERFLNSTFQNDMNTTIQREQQRDVRIKTRGKSNSMTRGLGDNQSYTVQVTEQ